MAITVQQSPTHPNIANNNLVYVLTSNQISQPQYQFVLDVKDENDNLVQRIKQQPNPSGKGVFDIGQIIAQQFSGSYENIVPTDAIDNDLYRTNGNIPTTYGYRGFPSLNGGAVKQFNVYIGEEYAASSTATSSLYDGNGSLGNPAVTASNAWELYSNGVLDINTRFPKWSADWNLVGNPYDNYIDNFPVGGGYTVYSTQGKSKFLPQPFYGKAYNGTGVGFVFTDPPFPTYNLEVGLTDFPITRSIQWDDYATISYFQGTDAAPDRIKNVPPQSGSYYIPKFQWISKTSIEEVRSDGTSNSFDIAADTEILQRNTDVASYEGNPRWQMYSQSIDDTIIHYGIGPMNLISDPTTGIPFRDPINYPNGYTTHYNVYAYGSMFTYGNASSFQRLSGTPIAGYESPEPGTDGYGFRFPLAVLSTNGTDPTGSYNIGATIDITDNGGTTCVVRINEADFLYPGGPGAEYPCASALAMQSCINRDLIASGSTARCFLVDNDNTVTDASVIANVDPKFYSYNLLIMDDGTTTKTSGRQVAVLEKLGGTTDAFGINIVGSSSCTVLPTGLFTDQGVASTYVERMSIPYISTGSVSYGSTFDIRRYNIDWSNFPNHYNNCGYEKKQFVWVNKYGAYDYYTFTLAESITDDIERQGYKQSFLDFSTNTNTIDFDKSRRGNTQYYNKPTQRYTVESNWLTQEEADAVREMFFSTDVNVLDKTTSQYISDNEYLFQANGQPAAASNNLKLPQNLSDTNVRMFDQVQQLPIVVTNASVTEKTNPRTQKLFRYTVEFEYANDLKPRV